MKYSSPKPGDDHVFETLAFLSTVGLIVIFVVLFQMDRAGRQESGDDTPGA